MEREEQIDHRVLQAGHRGRKGGGAGGEGGRKHPSLSLTPIERHSVQKGFHFATPCKTTKKKKNLKCVVVLEVNFYVTGQLQYTDFSFSEYKWNHEQRAMQFDNFKNSRLVAQSKRKSAPLGCVPIT